MTMDHKTDGDYVYDETTRKYLEETLNETDSTRKFAIHQLNQWIQSNPELNVRSEPKYLLPFLRGCKFNLERTKQKLVNYYTFKRDCPEWFSNRDPNLPNLRDLIKLGVFVPLKMTNKDNQLIVIIRTGIHDPKIHKQDDVFKICNMILDVACNEMEKAQIFGVLAIFDMAGVTFAHARQLTPSIIKKAVYSWRNYHCRPKLLEFIRAPLHVNVILKVFKSFMSEKMRQRVRVHFGDYEAIHRIVPKEMLPREYGGEDEPLCDIIKFWESKLLEYSDWFRDDEKFKAN